MEKGLFHIFKGGCHTRHPKALVESRVGFAIGIMIMRPQGERDGV